MAEEVEEVEEEKQGNAGENEAEALERLLMEEGGAALPELEEEGLGGKLKSKKILFAGIGLLLLLGIGAVVFLMKSPADEEVVQEEVPIEEPEVKEPEPEKQIPNIFTLKPFFLPLLDKGKETGQFINIQINLLLSNKKLGEEVENVLPLVRQTIYQILERKRLRDFNNPKKPIDDRLKSEIVTSTNTLLVSGSGKIEDVYFAELMVR